MRLFHKHFYLFNINKKIARKIAKEKAEQEAWEASRAGQTCKNHPEWSKTNCEKLADNKIWRGRLDSANPSDYRLGIQ